jgi:hypothetical protein
MASDMGMQERLNGEFIVAPDPDDRKLAKIVTGIDQDAAQSLSDF